MNHRIDARTGLPRCGCVSNVSEGKFHAKLCQVSIRSAHKSAHVIASGDELPRDLASEKPIRSGY
jgi:hypothetical protein